MKVVVLALLLCCGSSSFAQPPVLHAGLNLAFESMEEFIFYNQRLLTIYKQLQLSAQCKYLPAARGLAQLAESSVDGAAARTGELGEQFPGLVRIEPPVGRVIVLLYRRKGSHVNRDNWRLQRVASLRGALVADDLLAGVPAQRLPTIEVGLKLLSSGRVDVLLTEAAIASQLIEKLRMENVEPIYPPLLSMNLHHYLLPHYGYLEELLSERLLQLHLEQKLQ